MNEEKSFELNYILASCMYGTLPLAEIVPEVKKIGGERIDIWPRVHGDQREQVESMGNDAFAELTRSSWSGVRDIDPLRFGSLRLGRGDGVFPRIWCFASS